MEDFLKMSFPEQQQYFVETGNKLGLPPSSIEKDFWVCWTLRKLFELPEWGEHLTFKGGTSLSKGWKLIQRFSEDIDIVIDRDFLGFEGSKSPGAAATPTACRKRLKSLKTVCGEKVKDSLKPSLEKACRVDLPASSGWTLLMDIEDPDEQTLLFRYPGSFTDGSRYLMPQVKIELGARSDTEPSEKINIAPYLADAFEEMRPNNEFSLRAVSPLRTFWEKAMLLHEESFRPTDKPRRGRLARHYYDLACLIEKGVAEKAARSSGLFERVAAHRKIYFAQSWVDYGTLKPGSLRLSPTQREMDYWTGDYTKMAGEMFFGTPPSFDKVLKLVGRFEKMFNDGVFKEPASPNQ